MFFKVNLFHPAKMGLTNIQRLHEALGSPADGLPAVHIAGTNGKVQLLLCKLSVCLAVSLSKRVQRI